MSSVLCDIQTDGKTCSFDVRSDVNFANAIRRSLMEKVERYSPDRVEIEVNTTSQTDEYISHRIGLVPFDLSPSFRKEEGSNEDPFQEEEKGRIGEEGEAEEEGGEENTGADVPSKEKAKTKLPLFLDFDVEGRDFLSSDMKGECFLSSKEIAIVKMVKGQRFKGRVFFRKDRGSSHARFSHVDAIAFREKEVEGGEKRGTGGAKKRREKEEEGEERTTTRMSFCMLTNEEPLFYLKSAIEEMKKELYKVGVQPLHPPSL